MNSLGTRRTTSVAFRITRRYLSALGIILLLLATAGPVHAQTVDNPTRAEFNSPVQTSTTACASPSGASDHLCTDGRVTGYRFDTYNQAGTTLVAAGTVIPKASATVISGAGTPAAVYSIPVPARAASATLYMAKVVAIGPSGEGASALAGPFRFPVPIPVPGAPTGVVLKTEGL